jgi:5'-3' exonuclease
MNYILIDGSYYCFYRYYAIHAWFRNAHKEITLENPIDNELFVEKFKKMFINKLKEMPKKLKLPDCKIIIGKDCSRKDIWRNKYSSTYKETRVYDESFMGGQFFKMAYDSLFREAGIEDKDIVYLNHLEADDCLALLSKHLIHENKNNKVTIITGDMDYLQLAHPQINLINLRLKPLATSKNSTGDPKQDLFIKIVTGDKSDNISGVFPKCGKKTAIKYWNDKELFEKKLNSNDDYILKYENNRKIIDFNCIPDELVTELKTKYDYLFKIE